jgi:hypothetical protein
MRRIRDLLGLCGLLAAVAAGCHATDNNNLRPPKQPDEFRAPPESDPRYSRPIEYPKDTMDQDSIMKKAKDAAKNNGPGGSSVKPGLATPGGLTGRGF